MTAMRTDILKADKGRIIVYKTALRIFCQHPWFGYGPDLFSDAFRKNRGEDWYAAGFSKNSSQGTAHNDILQAMVNSGIFWTTAYLLLCASLGGFLFLGQRNGILGAALALFTYAKLNETAFPVNVVFFILAGAALNQAAGMKSRGIQVSMCAIMALTFYFAFADRMIFWARCLETKSIVALTNSLFRMYGG